MSKLTTLCLLALFLSLATCETSFRPSESPPEFPYQDPHKDVSQFFEGLFAHFDLDKPKQIIYECFCEKTAALYIDAVYNFGKVLEDMHNRDSHEVHKDFVRQVIIAILEHPASDCIVQTQDFSDLVAALGIKRDPMLDNIANWLYYQAEFAQMYEDYKPLIQNLDAKNFSAAGDEYAAGMKKVVDVVKEKGFYYLAHKGFANGYALGLDIDLPSDSLTVWNDTTAAYDLEFMIEASRAVAEGNWWESYENLVKFWNEKGEDILGHIPMSVWECLQGSEDNKKIAEKVGVDVMSKEFEDLAIAWIKKNPWKYHAHAKLVLKNFKQLNVLHVGSLHAQFVSEIAKTKS